MDEFQQKAIKKCMPKLINELDVGAVILQLRAFSVLTSDDLEKIQKKTTASESRLEFLNIIQRRDNAWGHLLNVLASIGQRFLAELLQNECVSFGGSRIQLSEENSKPASPAGSPTNVQNWRTPRADPQVILQEMQASIRNAARRRTLEEQQEYIISKLDPHDAVTVFKSRGQGISEAQLSDIMSEKSKTRAAQALFEVLSRIESGYSMLIDYFYDLKRNKDVANTLSAEFEREEGALNKQIYDFILKGKVKENDPTRRRELIRILRQKFDVEADGQEVVKA